MVYILPALMHAALVRQRRAALMSSLGYGSSYTGHGDEADTALAAEAPPTTAAGTHQSHAIRTSGCAAAGADVLGSSLHELLHPPVPASGKAHPSLLTPVVRKMLTSRRHLGATTLLVWGLVTGALSVGVTVEKQIRAATATNVTL